MAYFDGTDDFFDSRELILRIDKLEAEKEELNDEEWQEDGYADELQILLTLRAEADNPEFVYGQTFIADHYFEDYARELVNDYGYLGVHLPALIATNIDWEGIAEDLKIDYSEVELEGTTYYYR